MNKTYIYMNDLSVNAKKELTNLVENEENAFDLLLKNHSGEKELTTQEIVSRMQMQYFATNPEARELKSNDDDGWDQFEEYEPNEVNLGIASVVETNEGAGTVTDCSLLTGALKVQLHNNPDAPPKPFNRKEVKLVRDSKIKVDKAEIEALKDIEGWFSLKNHLQF